ncbi:hypothetical protein FACS189443_5440 [Planctomycetales bacterium]|nr:hypothetical protein FACS189443_5440 [Planctomycetales bacterium]
METTVPVESLCNEIIKRAIPVRIRAIELILRSLNNTSATKQEAGYTMQDVFAAWTSDQSPEEMAAEIRQARHFDWQREEL